MIVNKENIKSENYDRITRWAGYTKIYVSLIMSRKSKGNEKSWIESVQSHQKTSGLIEKELKLKCLHLLPLEREYNFPCQVQGSSPYDFILSFHAGLVR